MNRSFTSVAVGSLIALIGSTANGAVVKVRVSAPTCNAPQVLTVRLLNHNGSSQVVPVVIDPVAHASPAAKAAAVVAALQNAGVSAQPLGVGEFQIDGGPNLKEASLEVGSTGEQSDVIKSPEPTRSTAAFQGAFEPCDPVGQPAIFTAGIVTDIGELTVRISAQELNFQTEGPVICQALFQRLAPRAPQYGAQINYAGDRLEVYFDPAYSITMGGIVFGTTSLSPGAEGMVVIRPPIPITPDDMNCDGLVNGLDVDGFILAILSRNAYEAKYPGCNYLNGDMNSNGEVTVEDTDAFVARLAQ